MTLSHPRFRSPRSESSVLASVTLGLEEFIDRQGGDSRQVLSRAGLRSGLYREPNRHISLKNYCHSMHEAARSTGNEHFGLWFGEQFDPQGLGLFGYFATTSPDLRSAIAGMQGYFDVFQRNSLLGFSIEKGICQLEYRLLDGDIVDRRQDAELTVGMLNNVLRRALGERWSPLEVHFQHPALVNSEPHRDAFQCDVRFQQARNLILFPEACLDKPMPDANEMLNNVVRGTISELVGEQPRLLSTAQQVKSELLELLPEGDAGIDQVARRLNLSKRTLQRQLSAESYSFKELVDELREELAIYYLEYQRLSISEVAFRLGYSEISAFTRAFIRWKSMSPSDWRTR
ncbi:Transcriptional regulator, AraC family [Marinobacterium lacunae]|uniref:Transcriptional regulator, AraC family n=1 Tax=Marinobacterium lacunae TaxID=1232683 RepID=A0A081G054_9GAMM|nr:AraC family transcriptional regulator [Marinobacterium lacunae]KEA64159.1 Transcriptional regulator, AraC family [Marinobacterium lacunae]